MCDLGVSCLPVGEVTRWKFIPAKGWDKSFLPSALVSATLNLRYGQKSMETKMTLIFVRAGSLETCLSASGQGLRHPSPEINGGKRYRQHDQYPDLCVQRGVDLRASHRFARGGACLSTRCRGRKHLHRKYGQCGHRPGKPARPPETEHPSQSHHNLVNLLLPASPLSPFSLST